MSTEPRTGPAESHTPGDTEPGACATERTYRDLGWNIIQAALAQATLTDIGAKSAGELYGLSTHAAVVEMLAQVEAMRALRMEGRALPLERNISAEMYATIARCDKGMILEASELLDSVHLMRCTDTLRLYCQDGPEEFTAIAITLPRFGVVLSLVADVLDDKGDIRDDASVALSEARAKSRSLHQRIRDRLNALLNDDKIGRYLQDTYYTLRNERYVLPINTDFSGQVAGIVHDASQTDKTLFIEPQELVALGNALVVAEALAAEEEERIRAECSEALREISQPLHLAIERIAHLDVLHARAIVADILSATVPDLGEAEQTQDSHNFRLLNLRHPILLLQEKTVVGNTIEFAQNCRGLILSGPNAGGKTVAMTGVGLSVLMLWAGLPIPVNAKSSVPLFSRVYCVLGDTQDVANDLSTFSAHLFGLKHMLQCTEPNTLYLIDEIASGTDPIEGAAIAQAVLETLSDMGGHTLVTTHLEALKALAITNARFQNGSFSLDPHSLAPSYALTLGLAGVSNALAIAHSVGLPQKTLERAQQALEKDGALSIALQQLNEQRQELQHLKDLAQEELNATNTLRHQLEREHTSLRQALNTTECKVRENLAHELDHAQKQIGQAIAQLQQASSMQTLQQEQKRLAAQKQKQHMATAALKRTLELESQGQVILGESDMSSTTLHVGQDIHVSTLGQTGTVIEVGQDAQVLVRVGSLKMRVARKDLRSARKRKQQKDRPGTRDHAAESTERAAARQSGSLGHRCDLRGMRVDEAQRRIEVFLDQAFLRGPQEIVIVHGHGQGVLRKLARECIERSVLVASYRAGQRQEGGDGVTLVQLKES